MYMPYTTPSDLGEMLEGWMTLLFVAGGAIAGFVYRPLSNLPLIIAYFCWVLAAILVHRMEDDREIQPQRMKALSLLAAPLLLLFLNGLLDTHQPTEVEVTVANVHFGGTRFGDYTELRALSPEAPFEVLNWHGMPGLEVHRGTPAQVCMCPGAFGLSWVEEVVFNPKPPAKPALP